MDLRETALPEQSLRPFFSRASRLVRGFLSRLGALRIPWYGAGGRHPRGGARQASRRALLQR
jgi:hypothetical protein